MHVDVCSYFAFVISVRFDRPVVRGVGGCERVCVECVVIRCEQGGPTAEPVFAGLPVAMPASGVVCDMMDVCC